MDESESDESETDELESDELESNGSKESKSNGSSFDIFFDVTVADYMTTHPECKKDSSEDDAMPTDNDEAMPALERLQVTREGPTTTSETDDEMPPLMPPRRRTIAHAAWDSDSDTDSVRPFK